MAPIQPGDSNPYPLLPKAPDWGAHAENLREISAMLRALRDAVLTECDSAEAEAQHVVVTLIERLRALFAAGS